MTQTLGLFAIAGVSFFLAFLANQRAEQHSNITKRVYAGPKDRLAAELRAGKWELLELALIFVTVASVFAGILSVFL